MEFIIGALTALWIGILTSISPCPLATNIAAITYISKKVTDQKKVLFTGLLYTLGRVFIYIVVAFVVLQGLYAIPALSYFLQTQIHKILGPLLVIVGMFLLELVTIPMPSFGDQSRLKKLLDNMGMWGAFPIGVLFALSFCPVSAALFFGSLIPLASKFSSSFLLPLMYGVGTGLPVLFFAILLVCGVNKLGNVFKKVGVFEYWFRIITGVVFIAFGIYLSVVHIFLIS